MTDEMKQKLMQGVNLQGATIGQLNMLVEQGATVNYYGGQQVSLSDDQKACAQEIAPVFWGDMQAAEQFVAKVQGMNDKQIVELVVREVKVGHIQPLSFRKPLYEALSSHNMYRASKTNFDTMLKRAGIDG